MAIHSVDFPSLVNLEVIHGAYGIMQSEHHHPTRLHFHLQSQKPHHLSKHQHISPILVSCDITSGVLATAGCTGALFCW